MERYWSDDAVNSVRKQAYADGIAEERERWMEKVKRLEAWAAQPVPCVAQGWRSGLQDALEIMTDEHRTPAQRTLDAYASYNAQVAERARNGDGK